MSNGAVDLKIRILVICRAVGLKVVGLVITAGAVGLMGNRTGRAGSGRRVAGRLDVLVFRPVLRCSVVRNCEIFSGIWLGFLVARCTCSLLRTDRKGG